ncbi:unknown [Bacteroides sp. CAG:189]|nr:unknown [Bacteroides sp. CAG:189]
MLTILWLLPTILWEQKKTQIKKKKWNEEKNRNQV